MDVTSVCVPMRQLFVLRSLTPKAHAVPQPPAGRVRGGRCPWSRIIPSVVGRALSFLRRKIVSSRRAAVAVPLALGAGRRGSLRPGPPGTPSLMVAVRPDPDGRDLEAAQALSQAGASICKGLLGEKIDAHPEKPAGKTEDDRHVACPAADEQGGWEWWKLCGCRRRGKEWEDLG